MKKIKLSKLENNYYYGISRVFWHIIIGVATLAFISGIVLLIWSKVPVSEKKVVKVSTPVKKNYPKPVGVTLGELKRLMPKGKELIKEKNKVTKVDEISTHRSNKINIVKDTTGLYSFGNQLNMLKILIPFDKNKVFWNGKGEYIFPGGERDKRMFRTTKDEKLRKWITTSVGFRSNFVDKTDKYLLKSYEEKALLLTAYNHLLEKTTSQNRISIANNLLKFYSEQGLGKTIKSIEAFREILRFIPAKYQVKAFDALKRFNKNNKIDGIGMQVFQGGIIQNFEESQRLNIINTINKEYRQNYDYKLSAIIDNTNQFIPMLRSFKGDEQPVSLQKFYKLFKDKNGNRNQQILNIDRDYTNQLSTIESQYNEDVLKAKSDLLMKKQKKKELETFSYKSMLYGLGIVLLISLILLVLSMIRNVNRLAEAMLKNNNA